MSATNVRSSSSHHLAAFRFVGSLLSRAEWRLLGLVAALCVGCVVSAARAGQAVDWLAFFPAFGASLMLVVVGVYVRATRPMQRLALGAIGFGIFMCFTGSVAIFIYTLFPLSNPMIDRWLIASDAHFGYSWLRFVDYTAIYPAVGLALRYVYLSILPQVVGVIILLSFLNRAVDLHRFLTVGILCMIVTVSFWWLFPSVGPAAYGMVSQDVQAKIGLIANAAYGEEMRRLSGEGIAMITPASITGVIAFPSFHMIMACMVVWFTRRTWVSGPVLLVNIAMVPATLAHGGHHLIDLFGGLITFAGCLWAVTRLIPEQADP